MAWIMDMLFSKLNDQVGDNVKSAMISIVLSALRYNLVKEPEMDRMLARLLTDHRTISTTGFVVYLLQVFTCRMRMSPLQHWPITTEVIYKMLQRVTAAGPLIPPTEKGLAAQLDSFSKEMKAVANVSADRIAAYRQLHCLSTRPPEPLPWDIVANQALVLPRTPTPPSMDTMPSKPLTPEQRVVYDLVFKEVVALNPTSYQEIPHSVVSSVWMSLRNAGCEIDGPAAPGPLQQQVPEWVEGFFHAIISKSIEASVRQSSADSDDYDTLDSGIALLMMICSRSDVVGDRPISSLPPQDIRPIDILRCKYLRKLWDTLAKILYASREDPSRTNQRLFFRILSLTVQDAVQMRPDSTAFANAVLSHFSKTMYSLVPQFVPLFTFAWFDLLANRFFLPMVLGLKGQRGWMAYSRLLVQGFAFVAAAVEQAEAVAPTLPDSVEKLIQGMETIVKILLVDCPEFLILYGTELVIELPTSRSLIHTKNLILSAVPRTFGKLPDPFTTAIKLDNLPDGKIGSQRAIGAVTVFGLSNALEASGIRSLILQYVASCVAVGSNSAMRDRSLLAQIRAKFTASNFDKKLVQAFLHFVGNKLPSLVKALPAPTVGAGGAGALVPVTLSLDIFMDMIMNCEEGIGRRAILEGMVNMLRFPNAQTSLFSIAVLFIFAECPNVAIKEEITRVLLERVLVKQVPHPWGILATFSELVKNPRFAFWNQPFVRENEEPFKTVALLCFGGGASSNGQVTTPTSAEQVGPSTTLQQIVEQQRSGGK
jgi:hypothetical protein